MQICTFDGAVEFGKPKDWIEELDGPCSSLPILPTLDTRTGNTLLHSVYKPTLEELHALVNGGAIRLTIAGKSHPVMQIAVISHRICEAGGVEPMHDLGPVIDI